MAMAVQLRPDSLVRVALGNVALRLARCRRLAREGLPQDVEFYQEFMTHVATMEAAALRMERMLDVPAAPVVLGQGGRAPSWRLVFAPAALLRSAADGAVRSAGCAVDCAARGAARRALRAAGQVAGTAGGVAVSAGQASVVTTFRATSLGVRSSAQTSWRLVRPPLEQAVSYVVTPSGFFTSCSTLCALGALPLAALASLASAGAVTANAASASLQTCAELVRTGACRGTDGTAWEVLQRALRDPDYARELEEMLRAERQSAQSRRKKLLRHAHTWASVVNSGLIARVAPRVSDVVSRRVLLSGQATGLDALRTALSAGAGALDEVLAGQRSALVESTRVTLSVSTWLNTTANDKVDLLRSSSGRSVECVATSARHVAEYRSLGLAGGSRAACRDAAQLIGAGLVEGPAAHAVARLSVYGSYVLPSFATRWLPWPSPDETPEE
ncbi:unnamed protein product [Effrenium voratum]|nr:unnamed protein product [Effrenium voratum]